MLLLKQLSLEDMRIVKESEGLASAALLVTTHLESFIVNAPYLTQVRFGVKAIF